MTAPDPSTSATFTADLARLLARDGIDVRVHTESDLGLTIDAWRIDLPNDVAIVVVGRHNLGPFAARRIAAQIRARLGH